jgi:hypothetical protein
MLFLESVLSDGNVSDLGMGRSVWNGRKEVASGGPNRRCVEKAQRLLLSLVHDLGALLDRLGRYSVLSIVTTS